MDHRDEWESGKSMLVAQHDDFYTILCGQKETRKLFGEILTKNFHLPLQPILKGSH